MKNRTLIIHTAPEVELKYKNNDKYLNYRLKSFDVTINQSACCLDNAVGCDIKSATVARSAQARFSKLSSTTLFGFYVNHQRTASSLTRLYPADYQHYGVVGQEVGK